MKNNKPRFIEWYLFRMLFTRTKFNSILKKYSLEELCEWKQNAIAEDNFELAAYLNYYIEFKFEKLQEISK